ncbi:unnamed protein product [Effrenium voratum]|uniref:Uncharacterized protein n=1 Tax=Effrenium voratum TaxID=2562239 RepID=A0AA36IYQ3_9DINO|nr:unnamed protein product [Effrenium voratum]
MATEFQRARQSLSCLEESLAVLTGDEAEAEGKAEHQDWVLLTGCCAAERCILEEERKAFLDAEEQLALLDQLTVKMRRKCAAHTELEQLQAQMHAQKLDREVAQRVAELQSIAIYGHSFVEKVRELLSRFDAAKERFRSQVVPRLAGASTWLERVGAATSLLRHPDEVPHCEDPPEAAVVASCEADEVLCSERRKRQE